MEEGGRVRSREIEGVQMCKVKIKGGKGGEKREKRKEEGGKRDQTRVNFGRTG